jgi:hypothetical protein
VTGLSENKSDINDLENASTSNGSGHSEPPLYSSRAFFGASDRDGSGDGSDDESPARKMTSVMLYLAQGLYGCGRDHSHSHSDDHSGERSSGFDNGQVTCPAFCATLPCCPVGPNTAYQSIDGTRITGPGPGTGNGNGTSSDDPEDGSLRSALRLPYALPVAEMGHVQPCSWFGIDPRTDPQFQIKRAGLMALYIMPLLFAFIAFFAARWG